jgi:4-amino-4-deoxychorismate lyase
MNSFIESIRCNNRQLCHLSYHQARVNSVFRTFFPQALPLPMHNIQIPPDVGQGLYKCRILYSDTDFQVAFTPYQPRPIRSLKLVFDNHIDYTFKWADRASINRLFQQKAEADDVLIIKNGYVTDASYSNVAFRDGQQWFTPSTPLLAGTMRQYLLSQGVIKSRPIHHTDIPSFQSIRLFNAMMPFELAPEVSTGQLITSQ